MPAGVTVPDAAASRVSGGESRATPLRFVTATALFDGHDASIQVFRRLIQRAGAEVIHLGHNRSAAEIATAAIQEDADAVAVSSYQGGHQEFFRYLVDLLREDDGDAIRVFGGGGGVIRAEEAAALQEYGVARIYSPEEGLSLQQVVADMMRIAGESRRTRAERSFADLLGSLPCPAATARLLSRAEEQGLAAEERRQLEPPDMRPAPALGITGPGGAGKSSLMDELLLRFRRERPALRIGALAVDPTKRLTGGALLGDRIRLNAAHGPEVFVRSFATRRSGSELAAVIEDAILILRASGCELVLVETGGAGQGDSAIVDVSDFALYVMTGAYGAESQLDKIDMLDLADAVALNKADREDAADGLDAVRRAFRLARGLPRDAPVPVVPTVASRVADPGMDALFRLVRGGLEGAMPETETPDVDLRTARLLPPARESWLAGIAETLRAEGRRVADQARLAGRVERLEGTLAEIGDAHPEVRAVLESRLEEARAALDDESRRLLEEWPALASAYREDTLRFPVRGEEREARTHRETLAGLRLPRVALPRYASRQDTLRFLLEENLPGRYPFTAGVFPFRREDESPRRQFAGEGGPDRTNRRFRFLTADADAASRLSTAFDSVTLYGEDPARRPDIFGKIGEGGVSIATVEDMEALFRGFRLTAPSTSVSMTINGPAPAILAMFLNAAIRQETAAFAQEHGRPPDAAEREELAARTLAAVRGTVQADILKEDQAQNTCIFPVSFALRLMGDVQEYFIRRRMRNFYSVSISGYHIAEAGANPITQLAFTLANAFTYVEYYLARGFRVDDFARNLSFFFSNGLDAEYAVLARVARRIWARAMKLRYGASERCQKFKVHIQTSGRSLHAREAQFNDIRTTLQALLAIHDNCNSLHTNAYDEAITTPTEESVRRAVAIQKIVGAEFGIAWNENPLSGSFIIGELTDLVEEAVLVEFDRIQSRGGVLAAMERQYQRNRIQEESIRYETLKDSGELPVIGVNTFRAPGDEATPFEAPLSRASDAEKEEQVRRVEDFRERHREQAGPALARLREAALSPDRNVFAELMETVQVASLGQITGALYEVGGRYRRAM